MRRLLTSLCFLAFIVTGCRRETEEISRKLEFDAFLPIYNRYIENWLKVQQASTRDEAARVTTELTTAEGEAKSALELHAAALRLDQETWNFRRGLLTN